ncbi:T9SS type A sorting domain-containing protein [Pedobacter sp. BS3]|uniref:galactose-binding domain-containing protein n=1 Tax=Pedobacter sp. BS3 TaxID=2567937 RepID=UPI0011EBD2DA|nr:discoidin domain-containing protein [Pedobacter sp. BS3]TZF83272.1 T9SS type A sorting domain-containing protein [Pedobacter sp. BS3]
MKNPYALTLAKLSLSLVSAAGVTHSYAQSLTIDATSPRQTIIPSNGQDLSATTYNYVRVPAVLAIDTVGPTGDFFRSLRLSWAIYIDSATLPPGIEPKLKTGYANDGVSWTVSANVARFGSAIKLKNGKILALEFKPTYVDQHNFPLVYYTSVNNGASYTKHTDGMVSFTQTVLGIRMHKDMIEEPDGTLYTCAYIRYSFSSNFRTYVLKSTDGGKTWGPMLDGSGNPIEIAGTTYPTDEGTFTRCPDGSWLMIMKHSTNDPDVTLPLLYSRSTDKGQTWSTPTTLPGAGSAASGKNPCLILMPNGVLALTYGTPDVEVTFSTDNGNTWTTPVATFPDPGTPKRPSGNTWVAPIGPNTLLQFGDNYAKTINPNTQAIWQKEIEIVRPEQNRIDLKTKYKTGAITISPLTTLNATFPSHITARAAAAFDGSTNYWASAIGTNSGVYQLDLQQIYHIKTVGVALLFGKQESATVELSPDGTTWIPVKTYTNATHYCLNYTSFSPINARYVRVTVNGSGQIGLSELELYQTASTFENNAAEANGDTNWPHGILPTGYTWAGTSSTRYGAYIAKDNHGYQSDRALCIYDGSSTWMAGVKKTEGASTNKTLEFRCRPAAIPVGGSFSWRILGTAGGTQTTVFFFAVFAESSGGTTTYKIKANNGSGWTQVGTATMPVSGSVWKLIKVVANLSTNTASLYVDGVLAGTTGMYTNPSTTTNLTGFCFASNGTATSGELIYFDDVDFYDTATGPNQMTTTQHNIAPAAIDKPQNNTFAVTVSPNPSNNIVNVHIENGAKGATTILISDMAGRIVKRLNYNADTETSSISFNIQGYLPGVYVVTVKQNNRTVQTKLSVN